MEYRNLGSTNLKVSRLWLGGMSFGDPAMRAWVQDPASSRRIISRALDLGINTIDTCNAYCKGVSEEIIGDFVREKGHRDRLVLATKLGLPMSTDAGPNGSGFSRKNIIAACEASLRRLKTDYIDLYQTHIWQPATNVDELVEAFDHLVRSGKVLYVGATDMPAWQMAKAVYTARHTRQAAFASMQNHYNALWREDERELIPLCKAEGLALVPYSPLGRGFLCGAASTIRRTKDEMIQRFYPRKEDLAIAAAVEAHARQAACAPAAVALWWVLSTPGVTATVVGASSVEQIEQVVGYLEKPLDRKDMTAVDAAYAFRASKGHGG